MLIRSVIHHQIEHNFHVAFMNLIDQLQTRFHVAIFWRNAPIIAYIIAEIALRTFEEGRYPYGLETKFLYVVKLLDNAAQIAQTITIGIVK